MGFEVGDAVYVPAEGSRGVVVRVAHGWGEIRLHPSGRVLVLLLANVRPLDQAPGGSG